MRGNFHVRFLGEEMAVMPFPYPPCDKKLATEVASSNQRQEATRNPRYAGHVKVHEYSHFLEPNAAIAVLLHHTNTHPVLLPRRWSLEPCSCVVMGLTEYLQSADISM